MGKGKQENSACHDGKSLVGAEPKVKTLRRRIQGPMVNEYVVNVVGLDDDNGDENEFEVETTGKSGD